MGDDDEIKVEKEEKTARELLGDALTKALEELLKTQKGDKGETTRALWLKNRTRKVLLNDFFEQIIEPKLVDMGFQSEMYTFREIAMNMKTAKADTKKTEAKAKAEANAKAEGKEKQDAKGKAKPDAKGKAQEKGQGKTKENGKTTAETDAKVAVDKKMTMKEVIESW